MGAWAGLRDSLFVCPPGQTKEFRQIALSLALVFTSHTIKLMIKSANLRQGCKRKPCRDTERSRSGSKSRQGLRNGLAGRPTGGTRPNSIQSNYFLNVKNGKIPCFLIIILVYGVYPLYYSSSTFKTLAILFVGVLTKLLLLQP